MATPRRLILTSCGLTSPALKAEFRRMLGDEPEGKTCWYIPTAPLRDGMGQGFVSQQVRSIKSEFGVGRVEVIDPEYVKGEKLKRQVQELGHVDVIWAEMGNTYALRHHLRDSGGDGLVTAALDAGAFFVGASAGSILAGRTVQTAFWKDWDDKTSEGTISVDWTDPRLASGLDLAGGRSFFPHANGQYGRKTWQDEQARKHGHDDHEVVILPDGSGWVMEGDEVRCV